MRDNTALCTWVDLFGLTIIHVTVTLWYCVQYPCCCKILYMTSQYHLQPLRINKPERSTHMQSCRALAHVYWCACQDSISRASYGASSSHPTYLPMGDAVLFPGGMLITCCHRVSVTTIITQVHAASQLRQLMHHCKGPMPFICVEWGKVLAVTIAAL